ncbi:MAG: N-6 DNA methylase [Oscillochloridaceae bacterium]|nr:N-6 DNA methylase [Chloroflexaceae bacterium]MDW8388522.1 N-6 DNA methylase [Oscillochloridaceae bacterium]
MQKINYYKIPSSGAARELLRQKGQFWTPDWVAEAMVEYVLADQSRTLFDPAVGAGAFFRAAKAIEKEKQLSVILMGMDIDPMALHQAIEQGLSHNDLRGVRIGDFIFHPPLEKLSAIVANPPYIRHHRLSNETKESLKQLSLRTLGKILDGRAGLHVYFLIRALTLLNEDGRLAFIMPADTCEGKFAYDLWRWILSSYALDAVLTFSPDASPFPSVDTNPIVFFIRNAPPKKSCFWAKCYEPRPDILKTWVRSGFAIQPFDGLSVTQRELSEALTTGLSRPPVTGSVSKYVLGDFAQIIRGVATGANDFFFMTAEQVRRTRIPVHYFVRAIGRTRDVPGSEIIQETLDSLEAKGRPTYLLSLDAESLEEYPDSLRDYLRKGEALGLPQKPLISQRKPWYKMESRIPPPFLFAYLGRRNLRFIRNTAKVVPLTSFLCVYPKINTDEYMDHLWRILNHSDVVANLAMIGKSYGDGAVKVEPRALEKLPIPEYLIERSVLQLQMRLFESESCYKI